VKTIWKSALLVWLVASTLDARAEIDARQVFKLVNPSVVIIYTFNESGEADGLGTGFFIGDGTKIATNDHVVGKSSQVMARLLDGRVVTLESVFARDPERDLIILISPVRGVPLALSTRQADVGENILTIGNPRGFERTVSTGIVSGIRGEDFYQITAPASPGNSGGPVVDATGRVLGVTTLSRTDAQNLNFAVPVRYVARLLRAPGVPLSPKVARVPKGDDATSLPTKTVAELPHGNRTVDVHVLKIVGECCGRSGLEVRILNRAACVISDVRFKAQFTAGPNMDDAAVDEADISLPVVIPVGASTTRFIPLSKVEGHGNGSSDPLASRWFVAIDGIQTNSCSPHP